MKAVKGETQCAGSIFIKRSKIFIRRHFNIDYLKRWSLNGQGSTHL